MNTFRARIAHAAARDCREKARIIDGYSGLVRWMGAILPPSFPARAIQARLFRAQFYMFALFCFITLRKTII